MPEGLVARGIRKVRRMLGKPPASSLLSPKQAALVRGQLEECASGLGGEVSSRLRAARLAKSALRAALRSRRMRILTQFNALSRA